MKLGILLISLIYFDFACASKLETMFDKYTTIPKPFELRDPFQKPSLKSKSKQRRDQGIKGVWNEEEKFNGNFDIDKIQITGLLIGKQRRVLIKINGKDYKFKEDESIGRGGPKIKAILPGGIILVEQVNNIYGEPEYIETVVPISQ